MYPALMKRDRYPEKPLNTKVPGSASHHCLSHHKPSTLFFFNQLIRADSRALLHTSGVCIHHSTELFPSSRTQARTHTWLCL